MSPDSKTLSPNANPMSPKGQLVKSRKGKRKKTENDLDGKPLSPQGNSLSKNSSVVKQSRLKKDEMAWKMKLKELGKTVPNVEERKHIIL